MTPTWVRFLRDGELPQFLLWARANVEHNHFTEAELPDYTILVAEREGKILAYLPVKKMLLLESLAPNPDCSPMELASAMRELVVAAKLTAEGVGCKEMAFWDTDAGTTRAAGLLGFDLCTMSLSRRRI
jgi:hypothetical protein